MTAGWLVGRLACRQTGRPGRPLLGFNEEHKELKLTCSMIPSRENPLRDYIPDMIRLWRRLQASGERRQSGRVATDASSAQAELSPMLHFPVEHQQNISVLLV